MEEERVGHINSMLKKIKDELDEEETKLQKQMEDIHSMQRNVEVAQKEKEDAERISKNTTTLIRKLQRKASRWHTDTKVPLGATISA